MQLNANWFILVKPHTQIWRLLQYLNGVSFDSVDCYKDLEILFDTGLLKFHQPASEAAMKANRVLACIRRAVLNLNESVLLQLCKSMVWTILEYGNVIWGLHYLLDQCKLEGVQWRATKFVPSLRDESYIDRLTLNLPSLLYRFRCGDLIFLFNQLNGYFGLDYSNFFTLFHNTHIPEIIYLNYLSHLPIIYVASEVWY